MNVSGNRCATDGTAGCSGCHAIATHHALFTDHQFHDTGIGYYNTMVRDTLTDPITVEIAPGVTTRLARSAVASVGAPPAADLGRYEVTGDVADRWRYKTPSLRNVAVTAPYMHDGSLSTLRGVVEYYNRGAHPHAQLDPLLRPLGLAKEEVDALVAFLASLTGSNLDELERDARSQQIGNPEGEPATAR